MATKVKKKYDTVEYFRKIKENLAERMKGMNIREKREFMKKIREGKIKFK